jgi:CRISPR-associated endonuclease Csy4
MKFYHEITVIPNHEIGEHFIWSKLFTQIHLALVSIQDEQKKSPIGISFPEYFMGEKFGVIGSKLRLFAQSELELQKLDIQKWLSRLTDYIHISGLREVPQKISGYAIYNRHQPKVNKERLMRRHQKREGEWKSIINNPQSQPEKLAAAQEKLSKRQQRINNYDKEKLVKEPFIKLKSLSSDNDFCLWIKKTATNEPNYQKFSTYGLSGISTLPEF